MNILAFIKSFLLKRREFVMYYLVGNVALIIDFGLLYLLTEIFSVYYLVSATISFILASIAHYTLNKKYTFRNKSKRIILQYSLILISGIIALLLNLGIMFVLVQFFSLWYMFAKAIAVIIIFIFGYIFNKYVTYGMIK